MINGSIVALITPFTENNTLDTLALQRLIAWHRSAGTDAVVVAGTTGESPTLSVSEYTELIELAVAASEGELPIIAGCGAYSTADAIEKSRLAKSAGAAAGLSVVPYYNKPTQQGLYAHFRAVAEAVDLPLYLYNVPSRTVCDLLTETTLQLAALPTVVGLKDATGDLRRLSYLRQHLPSDFALFSGDDPTALAFMLLGGDGMISVTANVVPRAMRQLFQAVCAGDLALARSIHQAVFDLQVQLFVEPNPIPVKWALNRLGFIKAYLRSPLTPLSELAIPAVEAALAKCVDCLPPR